MQLRTYTAEIYNHYNEQEYDDWELWKLNYSFLKNWELAILMIQNKELEEMAECLSKCLATCNIVRIITQLVR